MMIMIHPEIYFWWSITFIHFLILYLRASVILHNVQKQCLLLLSRAQIHCLIKNKYCKLNASVLLLICFYHIIFKFPYHFLQHICIQNNKLIGASLGDKFYLSFVLSLSKIFFPFLSTHKNHISIPYQI